MEFPGTVTIGFCICRLSLRTPLNTWRTLPRLVRKWRPHVVGVPPSVADIPSPFVWGWCQLSIDVPSSELQLCLF